MLKFIAAVCGFAVIVMLASAYGKSFNFDSPAVAAHPPCTYETNNTALRKIRPDARLPEVIADLKGALIDFNLFSKQEQRIDSSVLPKLNYDALQPVTMILMAESADKGLITEQELLIITFDQQQALASARCEKFYTGP